MTLGFIKSNRWYGFGYFTTLPPKDAREVAASVRNNI